MTAAELRAALIKRNNTSNMPDAAQLCYFGRWYWLDHLDNCGRAAIRDREAKENKAFGRWAGLFLSELPDEDLMLLWAVFLM
jgi:hypothetical protein